MGNSYGFAYMFSCAGSSARKQKAEKKGKEEKK